jgi:hypothetical protein
MQHGQLEKSLRQEAKGQAMSTKAVLFVSAVLAPVVLGCAPQGGSQSGTGTIPGSADSAREVKSSQPKPAEKPSVTEITAEELGKETLEKASGDMDLNYFGNTLRVSGKVESVDEEWVYLATGLKHKEGQPVKIIMIFPDKTAAQGIRKDSQVVIEGDYKITGVFGPSFQNCRVIKKE